MDDFIKTLKKGEFDMSKKKLQMFLVSLLVIVTIVGLREISALAAPADPTPRKVEQADGSVISVKVQGDEFLQWHETLNGDVIAYNEETKNWHYAYISDEQLLPGDEVVGMSSFIPGLRGARITVDDMDSLFENVQNSKIEQYEIAASSAALTKNRIPLLVLLVEFNDRQFSTMYHTPNFPNTTAFWSNEFFGTAGKTVNTYFKDVSHDFDLQFTKPQFTAADGFRITNPTAAVSSLEIKDGVALVRLNDNHPNRPTPNVGSEVRAAFDAVKDYIDFSDVPRTNGNILNEDFLISAMIAGYESSASNVSDTPRVNGHMSPSYTTVNGESRLQAVRSDANLLGSYAAQGELTSVTTIGTTAMGIGVAIHEIGHLFGLPDLYDHNNFTSGLFGYSVMGIGSHARLTGPDAAGTTPTHFDPWSKNKLGFVTPITVSAQEYGEFDMHSNDASEPYNVLKVVSDVDPNQYFLVENRQMVGFDASLRIYSGSNNGGILIYHVDERVFASTTWMPNNNYLHKAIEIETIVATGNGVNPFYALNGVRNEFNANTTPNSNFHTPEDHTYRPTGSDCHPQTAVTDIDIYVNSNSGNTMEVQVGRGNESTCNIIAEGRFPDQAGVNGLKGAPWTLCEDGMLKVGEGFIHWTATRSPWHDHRTMIKEITFTRPITAGPSLANLFRDLSNVTTIKGMEHFDTSNVTDMNNMFNRASRLTSLDVSSWDTSNVTNMRAMFTWISALTSLDVSNWDTSNVTNMSEMFHGAGLTSLDVSRWDTSSVTDMRSMFNIARGLSGLDVSSWDMSNAKDISWMFANTRALTDLDVSKWDTSSVTNMSGVFSWAEGLVNLDVLDWNTSNVTTMHWMFYAAKALSSVDVSNWDTSNVADMHAMFGWASSLSDLDVSKWDTGNVTDMSEMFCGLTLSGLDVSNWDTSSVINMGRMFWNTTQLNDLDVSNWDTSNVKNMHCMFYDASALTNLDLSNWDTSNVEIMGYMFAGTSALSTLTLGEKFVFIQPQEEWESDEGEGWWASYDAGLPAVVQNDEFTGLWQNVGNGTAEHPNGGHVLTSDQLMTQFNGSTMADTWVWQPVDSDDCKIIAEGRLPDQTEVNGLKGAPWTLCEDGMLKVGEGFIHWTETRSPWHAHRNMIKEITFTGPITAGTSLANLFKDLSNVTTIEGLEYFDISNVTDMNNMFSWARGLTSLDVSSWDTSNVTNMSAMFTWTSALISLDVSKWDTSNVKNMSGMFQGVGLTSLDVSKWDTSSVTDMQTMFNIARDLSGLDVSSWDTSNVTDMSGMFANTRALSSLDVSKWDTSNVTNMSGVFSWAEGLTSLDLSNWNTSNVMNMENMFYVASALTNLNVSNWDTSNVENMNGMFGWASSLTSLDLSNWDTSNVENMSGMFDWASSLTSLDLSNWDTSSVTDMSGMFGWASSLTSLDLSNWDTSSVTNMSGIFYDASALTNLDLSNWDTSNVEIMGYMFTGTSTLRTLTLGEKFVFIQPQEEWEPDEGEGWRTSLDAGLPAVVQNDEFTGLWQNVGNGTAERPNGSHALTSDQLMAQYNGSTMADTWVWQPVDSDDCKIVAEGKFPDQAGANGLRGASWTLCEDGKLKVGEGFIHWTTINSPWPGHQNMIKEITFTGPITAGTSLANLFRDLSNVTTIEGLEYFDTSNVTNMNRMFISARNLTSLDVSNWDTSNVTDMGWMFWNAEKLTSLDVSGWDTSNVRNMVCMFTDTKSLSSLDLSKWDTSNVTNMGTMFNSTGLTSLDFSKWDTSNVTDMSWMFANTRDLSSLDVSNWDTSNVANMSGMFAEASALTDLNVSNWDTSNVTSMSAMFVDANALINLDLSNWDTSNVKRMEYMLEGTTVLRTLTLGEKFVFISDDVGLPEVVQNDDFTGLWQNVGNGTAEHPNGSHALTSEQLMAQYNGSTMADTWVWQPVITEATISKLTIDNFEGTIDQEAATITFDIPERNLEDDIYRGTITGLEADDSIVQFLVAGSEWPRRLGQTVGFGTGDKVYVTGGKEYTLVINATSKLIHKLTIDEFAGEIDQAAATITFNIPENKLTNGGYRGVITELSADEDTIQFWVAGSAWPLRQGEIAGFSTGDKVYVADGKEYKLVIKAQTPKQINKLTIGSFTGEIDQAAATITFRIPSNQLLYGTVYRGVIAELVADADTIQFWVDNSEWALKQGDTAGVSTGDKVYVAGGKVYTIKIIQ